MKPIPFVRALCAIPLLLCVGCFRPTGEVEPYSQIVQLQLQYFNPDGSSPQGAVLPAPATSEAVRLKDAANLTGGIINERATLSLDNLYLRDALGSYRIDQIVTQERVGDDWRTVTSDVLLENTVAPIDVVLVLDFSSSIGTEISKVQSYANNVISRLTSQRPAVTYRFGVITFNGTVQALPLTTDHQAARSFINAAALQEDSKLYEAIDAGVEMLQPSNGGIKVLLTFTDGRNNSWSDLRYATPDYVRNRLRQPTSNGRDINHFVIGWTGRGGVDESTLSTLLYGAGVAAYPASIRDVGREFNRSADMAAAIYNLVYDSAILPTSGRTVRCLFRTTVF